MYRYGLHWYNERERNLPASIMAERYEFVNKLEKPEDKDSRVIEFYIGDKVVATVINWPEMITIEQELPQVQE